MCVFHLQTTVPTLANQENHLNSNAPGPPGKLLSAGKDQATLMMRQKLHLVLGGIDTPHHHLLLGSIASGGGLTGAGSGSAADVVNHAYNSLHNVTASSLNSLR